MHYNSYHFDLSVCNKLNNRQIANTGQGMPAKNATASALAELETQSSFCRILNGAYCWKGKSCCKIKKLNHKNRRDTLLLSRGVLRRSGPY